jgi:hypothetical protein
MKEALSSSERRFLQEPHGVTSQKTPFFIVTAVKTSNLTLTEPSRKDSLDQELIMFAAICEFAADTNILKLQLFRNKAVHVSGTLSK